VDLPDYIQGYCQEALEEHQFLMTDRVTGASFGNELVRFENAFLIIDFVKDREQSTMEFMSRVKFSGHFALKIGVGLPGTFRAVA
jgi:hypothetical protein